MRTKLTPLRRSGLLAGVLVLAVACGDESSSGASRQCTAVGTLVGITLDIAPPYADQIAGAHMRTCWDGACKDADVILSPSSRTDPKGCTGEMCSAQVVFTGGKNGAAPVPGLPGTPVQVTLTLTPASGGAPLVRELAVTPTASYPNGKDCGSDGFQGRVAVAADGTATAVPLGT
ncbi:hypothetical protein [Yinghuangia seranimata]|uniref:hypothetical protein n=1 Tax=Yinghuangia seranimata TaxID=408067 RepID=UPI00248B780A|nr:hypothetical protein [Yinghuangia seranimata]MDI2128444.1 hypothetical protein [Yinghuangia seranimata]